MHRFLYKLLSVFPMGVVIGKPTLTITPQKFWGHIFVNVTSVQWSNLYDLAVQVSYMHSEVSKPYRKNNRAVVIRKQLVLAFWHQRPSFLPAFHHLVFRPTISTRCFFKTSIHCCTRTTIHDLETYRFIYFHNSKIEYNSYFIRKAMHLCYIKHQFISKDIRATQLLRQRTIFFHRSMQNV